MDIFLDETKQILNSPEALATIFAVVVTWLLAITGFLRQQHQDRKYRKQLINQEYKELQQQKQEHTLDTILQMLTNERLALGFRKLNQHIGFSEDYFPENGEETDINCGSNILMLMGYYEFVSLSFINDTLDRGVISNQRRSSIRDGYGVLSEFIEQSRRRFNRPYQFEHFQALAISFLIEDLLDDMRPTVGYDSYAWQKLLDNPPSVNVLISAAKPLGGPKALGNKLKKIRKNQDSSHYEEKVRTLEQILSSHET